MHPKLIQAHLHIAGSSPAKLARVLGVSHSAVQYVIRGRHRSPRIAGAICQAARLAPDVAFPGQYPLLAAGYRLADSDPHPLQEAA